MSATASVIVVSHGRPRLLLRTLLGLHQQFHAGFEVVVVACSAGAAAVATSRFGPLVKVATFDNQNISAARNIGIGLAAGEVVAFIDDDAVPEPDWLGHLVAPVAAGEAGAATGYVRGRNGISYQSRAVAVDRLGWDKPIAMEASGPRLFAPLKDGFIKTVGTNCAFRADILRRHGGFDPAFRFFMDETDLNARLSPDVRTAVVPNADVTHGFAASARRKANRMPTSLHEEAASVAIFLRKHATTGDLEPQRTARRKAQEKRLLRHLVQGTAEPRDVRRVMESFDAGWQEGLDRPLDGQAPRLDDPPPFKPFPTASGETLVLAGRPHHATALRTQAAAHLAEGGRALLFLLSRTALYHQRHFGEDGVWVQRGGQFGRSERTMPVFSRFGMARRVRFELARLRTQDWPEPGTLFMENEQRER